MKQVLKKKDAIWVTLETKRLFKLRKEVSGCRTQEDFLIQLLNKT